MCPSLCPLGHELRVRPRPCIQLRRAGLHLESSICRPRDRKNYSNILLHSWTIVTIAFRQGREFANSLYSSLVVLLGLSWNLIHLFRNFDQFFSSSLMFVALSTPINGASSSSADKAGHLTHSFKLTSTRGQPVCSLTTPPRSHNDSAQLNRESSAAVEHPIPP